MANPASGAVPRDGRRARSFGAVADLYDAVRPSYPPEAARWLLGERPCRVADLGAGTGIFTRVLVGLGHDVVAVEPDDEMRRKLGERAPAIQALAGSAEAIPLADASLDGVTAAQAHHWFDEPAAFAEIARVLRPGGVYGVLSNRRDESVEWVQRAHPGGAAQRGIAVQGATTTTSAPASPLPNEPSSATAPRSTSRRSSVWSRAGRTTWSRARPTGDGSRRPSGSSAPGSRSSSSSPTSRSCCARGAALG